MNDNHTEYVNTSATTWGGVKRDSSAISSMVKNDMKIVIKQTKAVIESEETILPSGDITIYLFPGKVKSGAASEQAKAKAKEILTGLADALKKDIEVGKKLLRIATANSTNRLPF